MLDLNYRMKYLVQYLLRQRTILYRRTEPHTAADKEVLVGLISEIYDLLLQQSVLPHLFGMNKDFQRTCLVAE